MDKILVSCYLISALMCGGLQDRVSDEKSTEAAMLEADTTSKNVKTFEQLMAELAEMESRIQQSADQSASVRVIMFFFNGL